MYHAYRWFSDGSQLISSQPITFSRKKGRCCGVWRVVGSQSSNAGCAGFDQRKLSEHHRRARLRFVARKVVWLIPPLDLFKKTGTASHVPKSRHPRSQ
jgi:hypothetical protein